MMEDKQEDPLKAINEFFKNGIDNVNKLMETAFGMSPKKVSKKVSIEGRKALAHFTNDNRVILEFEDTKEGEDYFNTLGAERFSIKLLLIKLFKRK